MKMASKGGIKIANIVVEQGSTSGPPALLMRMWTGPKVSTAEAKADAMLSVSSRSNAKA